MEVAVIETTTQFSPGWWFSYLSQKMALRNNSLLTLREYLDGRGPLPESAEDMREAYAQFQRKARTNFCELIVEAVKERMTPAGFRIGDEEGLSGEADRIWSYNELDTFAADVHGDMLGMRDGYVIVGPPGDDGIPLITREEPLLMVVDFDRKRPTKVRAALKFLRDEFSGLDTAYLYLPGVVYVAQRRNGGPATAESYPITPGLAGFEWVPGMAPMRWPVGFADVVPVVCFHNKGGASEFERHLDTIERINYDILQRLIIMAMQAFRQRAILGDLPETEIGPDGISPELDTDGNPVPFDLKSRYKPGPGSMWAGSAETKIWESQVTDITQILDAEKADMRVLAAQTSTPMSMLLPDSANQSATGADKGTEQLVAKTRDRIRRATFGWNQVMALALRFSGSAVSVLDIETQWLDPAVASLSERADAASKAVAAGVPWKSIMTDIMQFAPLKVEEMERQRLADTLAVFTAPPVAPAAPNGV